MTPRRSRLGLIRTSHDTPDGGMGSLPSPRDGRIFARGVDALQTGRQAPVVGWSWKSATIVDIENGGPDAGTERAQAGP